MNANSIGFPTNWLCSVYCIIDRNMDISGYGYDTVKHHAPPWVSVCIQYVPNSVFLYVNAIWMALANPYIVKGKDHCILSPLLGPRMLSWELNWLLAVMLWNALHCFLCVGWSKYFQHIILFLIEHFLSLEIWRKRRSTSCHCDTYLLDSHNLVISLRRLSDFVEAEGWWLIWIRT